MEETTILKIVNSNQKNYNIRLKAHIKLLQTRNKFLQKKLHHCEKIIQRTNGHKPTYSFLGTKNNMLSPSKTRHRKK